MNRLGSLLIVVSAILDVLKEQLLIGHINLSKIFTSRKIVVLSGFF
jgi:hypothetical protein